MEYVINTDKQSLSEYLRESMRTTPVLVEQLNTIGKDQEALSKYMSELFIDMYENHLKKRVDPKKLQPELITDCFTLNSNGILIIAPENPLISVFSDNLLLKLKTQLNLSKIAFEQDPRSPITIYFCEKNSDLKNLEMESNDSVQLKHVSPGVHTVNGLNLYVNKNLQVDSEIIINNSNIVVGGV